MTDAVTVQASVLGSIIKANFGRKAFADDVPVKELFTDAVRSALRENWMEPPAPAQVVLATAVAATQSWLKEKARDKEAENLMFEAKVIFKLMNDPHSFGALLAEMDPDDFEGIGIRPIWEGVCAEEKYDMRTARKL